VAVHAHGLVLVEAIVALGAYLAGVLFSGPDDLGRPTIDPTGVDSAGGVPGDQATTPPLGTVTGYQGG
jgi:hypothetical protein